VFNVCTGKGTSVRALAETMAAMYRTDLVPIYRPARPGEVRVSIGDPRLAAAKLDFRAVTGAGRWSLDDARPATTVPTRPPGAEQRMACRAVYLVTREPSHPGA
jgi:hypothetical protein